MAAPKKLSVIERRLQGPSALQSSSQPIPMTEKGWTLRWENADVRTDQIWHCINVLGWEYALPADLACGLEDIGANERDGRVVRGERGKEVLLKMRDADVRKVAAKKAKENIAITFNEKHVNNAVLNTVGAEHGSQAAEFVQRSGMTVQDSRERVTLDE